MVDPIRVDVFEELPEHHVPEEAVFVRRLFKDVLNRSFVTCDVLVFCVGKEKLLLYASNETLELCIETSNSTVSSLSTSNERAWAVFFHAERPLRGPWGSPRLVAQISHLHYCNSINKLKFASDFPLCNPA